MQIQSSMLCGGHRLGAETHQASCKALTLLPLANKHQVPALAHRSPCTRISEVCVYTLPKGKDILDSPRDQTEIVAKRMLVLPEMAVQTSQCDETAFPASQLGLFSLHPAQEKYVFVGKGENTS